MALIQRNLSELQVQKDTLLSSAWISMGAVERRELIASFCQGYGIPPSPFRTPTTFRARANDGEDVFEKIGMLLAPPAHCIKKAGRLNKAGVTTLYLSGTPLAAVAEIRAPLGATVSILAGRLRPNAAPLILAPAATSFHRGSTRTGPLRPDFVAGLLGHAPFNRWLRDTERLEQWVLQDRVLGQLLTLELPDKGQQALYEMTNVVRDHVYGTFPDQYDGVQYPSVVTQCKAPNIALDERRWADIEALEVWVTKVTREFENLPSGMLVFTQPLAWFGEIRPDGVIEYRKTEKTLLSALGDFKQKYGLAQPQNGLRSLLLEPYKRYRISYGLDADRAIDFCPAA
jgi:hypothetical protein